MMTGDQIQAELRAINARIDAKNTEARSLSGSARTAALDEADRLQARANELSRLLAAWMEGRLEEVVRKLSRMAREEQALQSDVFGRLADLARQAGTEAGLAAPTFGPGTGAGPGPQGGGGQAGGGGQGGSGSDGVASAGPTAPPADPDERHTDLGHLHPAVRRRVEAVIADLATENVPMQIFEAFRSPERQSKLFAQGRTAPGAIVTNADAWTSYHQYGMAVDMVIDKPGMNPWETAGEAAGFWTKYHEIARKHGLEPLSFEMPHIQLVGTKTSSLLAGEYPAGGDESWQANLSAAIKRWPGATPPLPEGERPPIATMARGTASAGIDWAALPPVATSGPTSMFGGRSWRVDRHGVYLDGDARPQTTPGAPQTAGRVVELYGEGIAAAARKHGLAPELIIMTIATETGFLRDHDFTGPKSFRWESSVGDYSAGPMQILSGTAREMNVRFALGYDDATDLPEFGRKPAAPDGLSLYRGDVAADIGGAYIRQQLGATAGNPILVAAAYNAGSLRASGTNAWGLIVSGDHLDRAARWFGDACAVLAALGR